MAKSMNLNMASGLAGMLKDGFKHIEGVDDAIVKNIEAAKQIAKITQTSLGPNGMNKLVINHLSKILVTSDASTILREMEVMHPAAKMLVMAADMQEQEIGDATNFTVSLAGELLSNSEELLRMGLHTSDIVDGYKKAFVKADELLAGSVAHTVEDMRDAAAVERAISAVLCAKQRGFEDILAPLVAQACVQVMPPAPATARINVDNVRVCKLRGGNISQSEVVRGIVVTRGTEGTINNVTDAKVCVLASGLEAAATEAKATVLIKDAEQLMNYTKGEEELLEEQVRSIAEAGINVIISGGAVSELALHFAEKFKIAVVRINSKFELRRMCRASGATALLKLQAPSPEEIGRFDSVQVREVGSRKVTVFRNDGDDRSAVSTIVLRSSTDNLLNDLERAIDDGVSTVKALCKDARLLSGGGATEIELAQQLHRVGEASAGLEQYAIKAYARALEVFPRTLAENSGQKPSEIVSSLYNEHKQGRKHVGVNIDGGVVDHSETGVFDCYMAKKSALRLANDAAVTVLRVDQIIMSKPAGGPRPGKATM